MIIGTIAGLLIPSVFFASDTSLPKTFIKEDFQITLTDDFKESQQDGFFASYESKSVLVFTLREAAENFEDITLEEYGELILESNNRTDATMHKSNELIWFEYTDTPKNQEFYYMVFCCQSEDAFWIVNFATPATNREKYKETFLQWAASINTDNPSDQTSALSK